MFQIFYILDFVGHPHNNKEEVTIISPFSLLRDLSLRDWEQVT